MTWTVGADGVAGLLGAGPRSATVKALEASGASSATRRKLRETVPICWPREMLAACAGVTSTVTALATTGLSVSSLFD